jgi:hypothetical protein
MVRPLMSENIDSDPAQTVVNCSEQLIGGTIIACSGPTQPQRDLL